MEKWLAVVGYEGLYEVSDHGRVRNARTGKMKIASVGHPLPRPFMLLWKNGKQKNVRIHRLVLYAFVGPPPHRYEGCHNDGNALNNHISNLRWGTTQSNQLDRIQHGTSNRGERCAAAKLTAEQVLSIRADPRLHKEIARDFGIRQSQVSRIKNRVRWTHL